MILRRIESRERRSNVAALIALAVVGTLIAVPSLVTAMDPWPTPDAASVAVSGPPDVHPRPLGAEQAAVAASTAPEAT
jgi:hypothetical protein